MAEQNRHYEDDYRNGRRYEPGRGQDMWRGSRGDEERDDRYRSGGDRDRWSMNEREGSYGRGNSREDFGGQDRGYDFSQSERYDRERRPSGSWGGDESREFGSRAGYGYDGGDRGREFGGYDRQFDRGNQDWGHRSGRGESGFGSGQGFSGGQGSGGSQGYQGYGSSQGYRSEQYGPQHGGSGFSSDTFGRGGENYGRGGETFAGGMGIGARTSAGRQNHAGKGPKNYKRSDERIQEEISDRLTEDPMVDASEITVQVKDGEVTLTGTVSSREEKRRAEDVAERCSGVREVVNNLRQQRQEQGQDTGRERTGQQSGSSAGHAGAGSTTAKSGRQSSNTE